MKKAFLMAAALGLALGASVLAASSVRAGANNDAGCGVGSLIFKNNDAGSQILASTTNGTLGNQSSGITTGTLGCSGGGVGKMTQANNAQKNFVAANFRDLSREMAAGRGEYVASLSKLMGCSQKSQPKFAHFAQTHYQSLFPSDHTAPTTMLKTLRSEMAQDARMSSSCTLL